MDLKLHFNKKNFHYMHRYTMYYVSRLITSIRVSTKKRNKMKKEIAHRLHRLTQIMKIKKISVNLCNLWAK